MSNSLWWQHDIAGVLTGLASSAQFMAVERAPLEMQIFQTGYMAALSAVAISLGIEPKPILSVSQASRRGDVSIELRSERK